ncbi:E3 ubiquitin-protein ligase RNF8 isoform X1 [Saimiri boliviensis]|uniref:E3 ubiquitin-protein ligase RNF8 isoform X1 n=1 Tax=Saimiri boliviensis TaxID=27679 RepID=UPI00193CE8A5|nr:E3 ubiquitin-protein ligase RNF8 isoform X1 [Saimiri boliviensis boliviensis]
MGEPGFLVTGDRAGGRSWCLRRVGMSTGWLLLEDGREVTVGRGFGVTYQLVSKICPLMISRNHCVLKQNPEGQWTITDNKSLNGVWLNRQRLEPLRVYSIHKGDYIQLGVPLENKENAEYEYEVTEEDWETIYPCLSPKNDQMIEKNKGLRTKRKFSLDEFEGPGAEGPSDLKSKINKVSCESGQSVKSQGKGEVASTPSENLNPKLAALEPSKKTTGAPIYPGFPKVTEAQQKASNSSASQSSLQLFKVTMSRILKLKIQMQEKQEAVKNVKKQTQKGNSKKIVKMEQELQDLQSQLCAEQAQQQARVEQLEKTFQEEEQHLQDLEIVQGEEDLKEQLAQALQEHRVLMEELNRSKKDFEAIIQAKNKELEQTKVGLCVLQEEKEKMQAQKEEVLSHMNDVLENELQCIICSEYFIEAVTLNCAHSFCSYCISEWMKRKIECPICRKNIESKTYSLVLDNCINKMVDNLSSEVKERRIVLIRERKAKRLS